MFVIAGVSGHTGTVVANTLLAAKQPVRVIVRDAAKGEPWKAKGAEVAVASLDDRAALAKALAGAQGAYLLVPPSGWTQTGLVEERKRFGAAIVGAVRDARPAHVVLLSSVGADLPSGTGPIQYLHPIENGLRETGVPSTFLRAAFFQDNWGAMLAGALDGGALYYGVAADRAFAQVATADIGKTAARLLLEGFVKPTSSGVPGTSPTTRVVELAGPQDLTLGETAAIFAKVGGKPVNAVSIPMEAMRDALVGMSASPDIASMYAEMAAAISDGRVAFRGTPERGAVTLEQRLRELRG